MFINTIFLELFKMAVVRHLGFFKSLKFQGLVQFGRPVCVIVPNFVPITQIIAKISRFLDFPGGDIRHLGFLVKRVELRHRAKFL